MFSLDLNSLEPVPVTRQVACNPFGEQERQIISNSPPLSLDLSNLLLPFSVPTLAISEEKESSPQSLQGGVRVIRSGDAMQRLPRPHGS